MSVASQSWLNFLALVSGKMDGSWYFRGEGHAGWSLVASIGRPSSTTSTYTVAKERKLFNDFKRDAPRFLAGPHTDYEWLAIGQHFGLPTRLLDWSTNPLVAAWFACEAEAIGADGRIHMIRIADGAIADVTQGSDPFDPTIGEAAFIRVPPLVSRITAQEGVFSVHGKPNRPWTPDPDDYEYEAFVIPLADKAFFRTALHILGFSRGRLMPGLDGLCATLAWRYRNPA